MIQEVLKKHGVCPLSVIQSAVDGSAIASSVTREMFDSTLESLAAVIRDGYYLKSLNDPVTDKYRNVILSVFKEKSALQKKDVTAMSQQQIPGICFSSIFTSNASSEAERRFIPISHR